MFRTPRARVGLGAICALFSLTAAANESLWQDVQPGAIAARGDRWVAPATGRTVGLDMVGLQDLLQQAPMEGQTTTRASAAILSLPMPGGGFARFSLVESPVMEAGLAAKFPEIRTYLGQGLDDGTATARLDVTPHGFHAQVLASGMEAYIDPFQRNDAQHYVVYTRADFGDARKTYQCGTDGADPHTEAGLAGLDLPGPRNPAGTSLRTYRLAIAATSSYTNAFGGTVADGVAGLTTLVNRLNGVYEREISLRLVLVANNDLIVYTNSNVGPIGTSPSGPDPIIQSTIDTAIGSANYDLGHAVGGSGSGGAITPLGNVCGTSKARGFTALNPPRGDIFDIDFVAHELGHQLGGSHTWNGCNGGAQWTATSAQEPGSGSTIMAYAGICPDNIQPNSDAYFHARSFTQIWQILNNGGPGNGNVVCGTTAPTGNDPPNLTAPGNMTIPERTPFQLTATGSDPNAGDVVTYNWEQVDTGAQENLPGAGGNNGTAPLFRSYNASTSPTRVFPSIRYILDNANVPPATITLPPAGGTFRPGEVLPDPASGTRVMNFRVTARDNRAGGGGLRHSANVQVTAAADAGPFTVGNVTGTQTGGGTLGVTWTVANTDQAPVSTSQVNILISLDGGNTFQPLLAGTANDGAETVTLPNIDTSRARIRVEAANGTGITAGNTYFDISDSNFQISAGGTPVTLTVSTAPADLIATQQGSPAPSPRNIATIAGGVAPFTLAADSFPPSPDIVIQQLQLSGNTVSATAQASCQIAAPNLPNFRTYPGVLKVTDSGGRQASAVFPINVSNNSIPTLGNYTNQVVAPGNSVNVSPSAAPADANGNQTTVTVSPTTLPGGGTVSIAPNGTVSVTTTAGTTLGTYTITASVSDSCGARTSKSFTLAVVSPNPVVTLGTRTVTSGNGVLEPNECNTLDVSVGNTGGSTATVVSAVLSTSTPGVSVFQANSTYPDIPSNGSQINNTDYEVSTAANLACGSTVSFTHTVTFAGGGPTVFNFDLPVGTPAATNYSFASQTGVTAPTGDTLVAASQDDDAIVPVTLPASFAFQVYGTPVTQLRADTNGVLIFNAGTVASTASNGALPVSAYGAPALFALWDDLDLSPTVASGGGIYTRTLGTAPNRTFDIEWRAVRWVQGAATPVAPTMVFSVRLHETTNLIEVYYTTVTGNGGGASGSSGTVGIQAAGTGTVFTQFSNNQATLSSGLRLSATRAAGVCTVGTNICGAAPDPVFANGFE